MRVRQTVENKSTQEHEGKHECKIAMMKSRIVISFIGSS